MGSGNVSEYGLAALLVGLVVGFGVTETRFVTSSNVLSILEQSSSTLFIVAVPFAMLLMARHIDLSVGSAMALYGVIASKLMVDHGWNSLGAGVAIFGAGAVVATAPSARCAG